MEIFLCNLYTLIIKSLSPHTKVNGVRSLLFVLFGGEGIVFAAWLVWCLVEAGFQVVQVGFRLPRKPRVTLNF